MVFYTQQLKDGTDSSVVWKRAHSSFYQEAKLASLSGGIGRHGALENGRVYADRKMGAFLKLNKAYYPT